MDAADLTGTQLEELAEDLRTLQQQLRDTLEISKEGAKPVELDQPIGRLSRIDAIQQQKMIQSNRRAYHARLKLVTAALGSLTGGDYGACAQCEEPIGYRRLKARPESRFCLVCQSAREAR